MTSPNCRSGADHERPTPMSRLTPQSLRRCHLYLRTISTGLTCSPRPRPCGSRPSIPRVGRMRRCSAQAMCWRCRRGAFASSCLPQATTTANLTRDNRVTMTLSLDGGMSEVRMRCHRLAQVSPDVPLACFEAELVEVRAHKAPYATVSGGITFALHEPQSVLARWQRQIDAMRQAGPRPSNSRG